MTETPVQRMEISGGYEQLREARIKENRERMQKLGIHDLSSKLKPLKSTRPYTPKKYLPPLPPSGPIRRSSRLQNSTPVSYIEVTQTKKDKSVGHSYDNLVRAEGSKPEVYTEEHEKLLGTTEMGWTLFVDGYGSDGKRIYDPVRGKTCHQCRQKTLGHRTHCSTCNLVQGQFCGDCLYMRYGENVLEAEKNPNWVCPACRGICNCSLCRQAKGWPPTGMLYRKIASLGYKSVAHYLIQTRRANTDSDENSGLPVQASAKRSLPFSEAETTPGDDDSLSTPNIDNLKTGHLVQLEPVNITLLEDQVVSEVVPEPANCREAHDMEKIANSMKESEMTKEVIVPPTPPQSVASTRLQLRRSKRNASTIKAEEIRAPEDLTQKREVDIGFGRPKTRCRAY